MTRRELDEMIAYAKGLSAEDKRTASVLIVLGAIAEQLMRIADSLEEK